MNEETKEALEQLKRRLLYGALEKDWRLEAGKTVEQEKGEIEEQMRLIIPRLESEEALAFLNWYAMELLAARQILDEQVLAEQVKKVPTISDAFANGIGSIWTALPFQAFPQAASNAASGADQWLEEQMSEHRFRLSYTYEKGAGKTTISVLSPEDEMSAQVARERIWQQIRTMGDLDGDTYLAIVAQLVDSAGARNEKGWTWISATRILDYRGIEPRKDHSESGKAYRAGHRQEDIEDIASCIRRMRNTRVTVDQAIFEEPQGGRGKGKRRTKQIRFRRESPLFQFGEVLTKQELWGKEEGMVAPWTEVAWQIQESAWMEPFIQGTNKMTGRLLQSCLHYDPYHEMWEKRLSRYLMFHLTMNRHSPTITRQVGALIEELSLEVDERNPVRSKDRFEKALNRLKSDGHIGTWRYKEDIALPARKWVQTWLAQDIVFTKPVIIEGKSTSGALPDGQ